MKCIKRKLSNKTPRQLETTSFVCRAKYNWGKKNLYSIMVQKVTRVIQGIFFKNSRTHYCSKKNFWDIFEYLVNFGTLTGTFSM